MCPRKSVASCCALGAAGAPLPSARGSATWVGAAGAGLARRDAKLMPCARVSVAMRAWCTSNTSVASGASGRLKNHRFFHALSSRPPATNGWGTCSATCSAWSSSVRCDGSIASSTCALTASHTSWNCVRAARSFSRKASSDACTPNSLYADTSRRCSAPLTT